MSTARVAFTGWESDRFVAMALDVLARDAVCPVRVIGREPITSTQVDLSGILTGADWQGYRRVVSFVTAGGTHFEVGGSNSTRPLASEAVIFEAVPRALVGDALSEQQGVEAMRRAAANGTTLEGILLGLRVGRYSAAAKQEIACLLSPERFATASEQTRMLRARLLGLLAVQEGVEALGVALRDSSPRVRREAALRFRGLEPLIKAVGEDSALGAGAIAALCEATRDTDEDVRTYATEDLGYFYDDAAIEALRERLEHDDADDVRWAAAIAIGRTNWTEAASCLLAAYRRDTAVPVRRGSLLGLGRLASSLPPRSTLQLELRIAIEQQLERPDGDVKDFAAFALGEVRGAEAEAVGTLQSCLLHAEYTIRSSAVASLTKVAGRDPSSVIDHGETIVEALRTGVTAEAQDGWPERAYFTWYLSGAGELAALLEAHDVAASLYERAAGSLSAGDWLAQYYEGIAAYERAESVAADSLSDAARGIERAIELFTAVSGSSEFSRLTDARQSGLRLKITLAEARAQSLAALQEWRSPLLSPEEAAAVAMAFDEAVKIYRRVDVVDAGAGTGEKELTRQEQNVVLGLQMLAEIGAQLCELRVAIRTLAPDTARMAFGSVTGSIAALGNVAERSRSRSLQGAAQGLAEAERRARSLNSDADGLAVAAAMLMEDARKVLLRALPTPGTCPIVDFGAASLLLQLPGAIAGDGSPETPFEFPSTVRMVLHGDVVVAHRTKNDRLIFRCVGRAEDAVEEQEVRTHESTYTLRPVDLGPQTPTMAAVAHQFVLEFVNAGCRQVADAVDVYVRVYDGRHDYRRAVEREQRELESLPEEIANLKRRLRNLRERAEQAFDGEAVPLDDRYQVRMLAGDLAKKEARLEELQAKHRTGG